MERPSAWHQLVCTLATRDVDMFAVIFVSTLLFQGEVVSDDRKGNLMIRRDRWPIPVCFTG